MKLRNLLEGDIISAFEKNFKNKFDINGIYQKYLKEFSSQYDIKVIPNTKTIEIKITDSQLKNDKPLLSKLMELEKIGIESNMTRTEGASAFLSIRIGDLDSQSQ